MFFTLVQNNSGGYFIINDDVSEFVIIEANNVIEATKRAKEITKDYMEYCFCCGERWDYDFTEDDKYDKPSIWGNPINEKDSGIRIYYLDGRIEKID